MTTTKNRIALTMLAELSDEEVLRSITRYRTVSEAVEASWESALQWPNDACVERDNYRFLHN